MVSEDYAPSFRERICEEHGSHCLASKTLFPHVDSRELRAGLITRVVQYPGQLVVTNPVSFSAGQLLR